MNQIEEIAKWQIERNLDKTGFDLDGANYRYLEEIFEMNGVDGDIGKKLAKVYAGYIRAERKALNALPTVKK